MTCSMAPPSASHEFPVSVLTTDGCRVRPRKPSGRRAANAGHKQAAERVMKPRASFALRVLLMFLMTLTLLMLLGMLQSGELSKLVQTSPGYHEHEDE